MYSWTSTAENRFLSVLSLTLPKPGLLVGEAGQALRVARGPPPAMASTMRSTCSWEKPASVFCAARARGGERARLLDREEVRVRDRPWPRRPATRPSGSRAAGGGCGAPPGRIFSTSSCGRGITCTETSSPTRRAAAAPASVAALTAPTSPRTMHGHVAGADVLLADEDDVGRLDHGVRGLDGADEALGLDHSQRVHGAMVAATLARKLSCRADGIGRRVPVLPGLRRRW